MGSFSAHKTTMPGFTKIGRQDLYSKPRVAITIPTLNEEQGIGFVLDGIKKVMNQYDCSVLVVDGYSTDRTVKIAKEKGATVIYQGESGYGEALITGLVYADKEMKSDIIVMMDADGTYDPYDIPTLLSPILENRADMVVGDRFPGMEREAMTFTNRVGNKILSWFARRALRIKINDTQCGLRALPTTLANSLDLKASGMPFAVEMLAEAKQAGARILEVPVAYRPRIGETKLNSIKDGLRILGTILRLMRDYEPLLFFGVFGFFLILIGILVGTNVFLEWIFTGSVGHLASVSLSSMLIVGGIVVFAIGLLADMMKDIKRRLRILEAKPEGAQIGDASK